VEIQKKIQNGKNSFIQINKQINEIEVILITVTGKLIIRTVYHKHVPLPALWLQLAGTD